MRERERRHSLGTRIFGKRNGWDWNFEFIYQFGDYGNSKIRAWTAASVTGFTIKEAIWSPRMAISVNIASGDDDPSDETLNTFNPLYPNLSYFEDASILSPQNFYNIEPKVTISPTQKLSITFEWNFFWRLSGNDAVYSRGLNVLSRTVAVTGSFVAHVPSIGIDYQINKHLSIGISYNYFFAQEVILSSGGNDINFTKAEVTWTF